MSEMMDVKAIKMGTVIDHIPAGQGLKILARIQDRSARSRLTVGLNLPSVHYDLKDIIKVEGWLFTEQDAAELSLFAPKATVNIIENYGVVHKFSIGLPEEFVGIFNCPNANCISNSEPRPSRFYVGQKTEDVTLQCHFCERKFSDKLFTR